MSLLDSPTRSTPPKSPTRIRALLFAAHSFNAGGQRRKLSQQPQKDHMDSPTSVTDYMSTSVVIEQRKRKIRRIQSRVSGRELELDDAQLAELSQQFMAMPDKYQLFETMFIRLFASDVEVAIAFGMHQIPAQELRRKTPFRTHVCKFQRFITTVMDLLPKSGREEELVQIIRMVGRQHTNSKKFSFTASLWLSFKNALLTTFSRGEKDKLHGSWSILFSFIIAEMKDAYLSHIRHIRSSSLSYESLSGDGDEVLYSWEQFRKMKLASSVFEQNGMANGNGRKKQ